MLNLGLGLGRLELFKPDTATKFEALSPKPPSKSETLKPPLKPAGHELWLKPENPEARLVDYSFKGTHAFGFLVLRLRIV